MSSLTNISSLVLLSPVRLSRAVANGPVGPAMAGPIIEPVLKKKKKKKKKIFPGRINNRASHFDFRNFFNTDSP